MKINIRVNTLMNLTKIQFRPGHALRSLYEKLVKVYMGSLLVRLSANIGGNLNINERSDISLNLQEEAQLRDTTSLENLLTNNNFIENKLLDCQILTNKLNRQSYIFEESIGRDRLDQIMNSTALVTDDKSYFDAFLGVFNSIKKINNNQLTEVSKTIIQKNDTSLSDSSLVQLANETPKSIGDLTLNEVFSKFVDVFEAPITHIMSHPEVYSSIGLGLVKAVPAIFIFKSLVNSFNKTIPASKILTRNERRERQVVFFILLPMLTAMFYATNQKITTYHLEKGNRDFISERLQSYIDSLNAKENLANTHSASIEEISSSNSDNGSEVNPSVYSIFPLFGLRGKTKNISLFVLFTIFLIGVFYKLYNINLVYLIFLTVFNPSPIVIKYIYLTSAVISFIFILRYILIITTIYLVKNQKLQVSIFKPKILNNIIQEYETLSKDEDISQLIDFYYKHMYMFIFSFLLALLLYYI